MKNNKNTRLKKVSAPKSGRKRARGGSINEDSFFDNMDKANKKPKFEDEDILSSGSDEEDERTANIEEKDEEEEETAAEKRKRIAESYVDKLRSIKKRKLEDISDDDDEDTRGEKEGEIDSHVAMIMQKEQMEESGRARKAIAASVEKPEASDNFRVLVKHRQSVTCVALSEDDMMGFSTSKDGAIVHWDIETGKAEKYVWPSDEILKSQGTKAPQGRAKKHSKHMLSLAVSSDNRYLATGGLDRHIHLWDIRTRKHIQAFPGHKSAVSCLAFRLGSTELFSGSFDRSIKIWNADDRAYMNTLYGHQSEVLAIDCLRKERVLSVGRDRTMHLWKVPEESQLVFRAPATSLDCCCFINNDEFLSGSDDGSIELWNVARKKPVHIVKNAHSLLTDNNNSVASWVSSVSVCRSSDLAASGAGNGFVRLWEIENESKGIKPLFDLPLDGFVNSLAFAKSGRFLVAGVGQEPRLGRWGSISTARNGVFVHPLTLS